MTSLAAHRDLELAVVNAAVWGPDTSTHLEELAAAEFLDPWCRDVVAVLLDLFSIFEPGSIFARVDPMAVAEGVERLGWRPALSPSIVLAEVTGAGHSIYALPSLLGQLRELAQRRAVLARLVGLAATLERPGGAQVVADALGWDLDLLPSGDLSRRFAPAADQVVAA